MALLTLKDIGKIYVSGGTVAVGIRGVNLSFEAGEFVAVTGKSGSGKSTLLNVISGMDSYEEGELLIEDQPTSHYMEQDRELYREKYISFIFQDYNIIESYTVLENVELALMHIENPKERRHRAIELLTRVGMEKFLKHKGSKLSGGQKQRTVIARALAKDSPIILADEPTGNLDSATSAEIINLLKEVSKDKLLIMVTHNFEQVEHIATRHIRVFDGAVESDRILIPAKTKDVTRKEAELPKKPNIKREVRNGITLGFAIFKSKPKLSFFMCILLIIATLGTFAMTASSDEILYLFEKNYMFTPIEGRTVIVRQDGKVITEEELQKLCADTGAKSYIHFDSALDIGVQSYYHYEDIDRGVWVDFTFGKDYGNPDIGRYPENDSETLLYVPISYQPIFGKTELLKDYIVIEDVPFDVVGVKYYYNNNLSPTALLTENGFATVTAAYTSRYSNLNVNITFPEIPKELNYDVNIFIDFSSYSVIISNEVEDGKMYIGNKTYLSAVNDIKKALGLENNTDIKHQISIEGKFYSNDYYMYDSVAETFKFTLDEAVITDVKPDIDYSIYPDDSNQKEVIISPSLYRQIIEEYLKKSYTQASLFYEDNKAAHDAVPALKAAGYIAVPSDTTCEASLDDVIINTISAVGTAVMWVVTILFLAFFVNLCTSRAIGAFKGEMAIMRSMGIKVLTIKIGMYVRMLISLIPAVIAVIAVAFGIFTSPTVNALFSYMYWWQYLIMFVCMLALVTRVTYKQIQKLFNESVKKSLRGGQTQ